MINIAPRPTTSAWVEDRGGHNDLMHILILDGDGKLTGTPGALLEKHLNVSKAMDARSPQGDNIYYKDVTGYRSSYILWGSHETGNLYDKDANASGAFGLSGVNKEFDLIKSDNALMDLMTQLTATLHLRHLSALRAPYLSAMHFRVVLMVTLFLVLTSWVDTHSSMTRKQSMLTIC